MEPRLVPEALRGGRLADGEFTVPPRAFLDFCRNYAAQCIRSGADDVVKLDNSRWSELRSVNEGVNAKIRPQAQPAGVYVWTLGATAGDCNAYAIEKRRQLIDLGWPSSALDLTVVYTAGGEAHLILTVRTDLGDFVLDNLREAILAVDAVRYTYVMRQSTIHPRLWVKIDGVSPAAPQIAARRTPAAARGVQLAALAPQDTGSSPIYAGRGHVAATTPVDASWIGYDSALLTP